MICLSTLPFFYILVPPSILLYRSSSGFIPLASPLLLQTSLFIQSSNVGCSLDHIYTLPLHPFLFFCLNGSQCPLLNPVQIQISQPPYPSCSPHPGKIPTHSAVKSDRFPTQHGPGYWKHTRTEVQAKVHWKCKYREIQFSILSVEGTFRKLRRSIRFCWVYFTRSFLKLPCSQASTKL